MGEIEPILDAIRTGDSGRVKAALAADVASAQARTEDGLSALMLALYNGHEDIARLLADTGITLDIFEAAAMGHMTRVTRLLKEQPDVVNAYAPDGFTPLGLASFFGRQTTVKILLERGADVHQASRNPLKAQPLHSAAANRHIAIAEMLLKAGADPNAPEQEGFTPLHAAAQNGQLEMVNLLLAHGANPGLTADHGKTAKETAVEAGFTAIAERLRRARL